MASIAYEHTIQKFIQVTDQTLLNELDQINKNKEYVSSSVFKMRLKHQIQNIYNGAVSAVYEDENSLAELEKQQAALFDEYMTAYNRILSEVNPVTADKKTKNGSQQKNGRIQNQQTNRTGGDIDPELRMIGQDPGNPSSYATFYNGKRENISGYAGTNNTYSMCDMVCQIDIVSNTGKHVVATLGKLQTLSYSIFQNKAPVRVIGNMNARDYVYGQRTIAGSLIFAVFNKHWLVDLYNDIHNAEEMRNWHFVADEIPPFNITITFANEYGYDSRMAIYGVRLVNEGQTMSINDIYIENTYEYVATDIEIMDSLNAWQSSNKIGRRWDNTAGAIASATPQQSQPETPKMQGQSTPKKEDADETKASFDIPAKLIDLSEEVLKNSTEEALKKQIKQIHDKYIDSFQQARDLSKKNLSTAAQKKIDAAYYKAEEQLGSVFGKQWNEIEAYYRKAEQDKVREENGN